jgi:hypothetical protein
MAFLHMFVKFLALSIIIMALASPRYALMHAQCGALSPAA